MNIFWGVVVAVLLHIAHHTGPGRSALNYMYDFLVLQDYISATIKSSEKAQSPISDQIKIVAFDQETYNTSASQGFWTPRVLLARSVQQALKLGAKVVVVDFAVNRPVPIFCQDGVCIDENIDFFELMHEAADLARAQQSVIILPWIKNTEENSKKNSQGFIDLIRQHKDIIKLATPKGFVTPSDNKVRHFSLYEIQEEEKKVIFSLEIMATLYSLYDKETADELMNDQTHALLKHEHHLSFQGNEAEGIPQILLCDPGSHGECLAARYQFRLTPRDITVSIFKGSKAHIKDPLITTPNLLLTPGALLAQQPEADKIYLDKIVLIGSTNPEAGDVHATPLGQMSGIYLIANGINVLLKNLQVHAPSGIVVYGIELIIILAAALFFLHLTSLAAMIVMAVIILIGISPVSILLFSKYGLFMDFWFPIIGIGLHKIIAEGEQWLAQNKKQ